MFPFLLYLATAVETGSWVFFGFAWFLFAPTFLLPLALLGSIALAAAGLLSLAAPRRARWLGLMAVAAIWPMYVSLTLSERLPFWRHIREVLEQQRGPAHLSLARVWLPRGLLLLTTLYLVVVLFGDPGDSRLARLLVPGELAPQARRRRGRALGWSVAAAALGLAAWCAYAYVSIPRLRYELPVGYGGWIHVDVEVPSCPPLPRMRGARVLDLKIDAARSPGRDAYLCTSDGFPDEGWEVATYFYQDARHTELPVTSWGGGGMVWGETGVATEQSLAKGTLRRFREAFIGTETQFHKAAYPVIELPDGFRGWGAIRVMEQGCPSRAQDHVVKVGPKGETCVIDWEPDDWIPARLFDASRRELAHGEPGHGGQIWGETGVTHVRGHRVKQFFVGSEAEYTEAKARAPIGAEE